MKDMEHISQVEHEYVRSNYRAQSVDEIASALGKDKKDVESLIGDIEKEREEMFDNLIDKPSKVILPYKLRWFDWLMAGILFVISLALYTYTLTPSLSAGDNGELTSAIYFLGIGHAPGYPIYVALAKIFTYLPFGNVAWRTNFFSAFCAATAVMVVYFILIKLLAFSRNLKTFNPFLHIPAFLGAFAFALCDNLWAQGVMAEVYTLSITQLAVLILIVVYWAEDVWRHRGSPKPYYGTKYLLAFAFLYGVSLGNHSIAMPFAFAPLAFFPALIVFINLDRNIKVGEVPLISVIVFAAAVLIAGIGYYRFIMSLNADLFFNTNPQIPNVLGKDANFFEIIFTPLGNWDILGDIIKMWSDGSFLDRSSPELGKMHGSLNYTYLRSVFAPGQKGYYPLLYAGMFIIFWPLFLAFVWLFVYKKVLKKQSEAIAADPDFVSDTTMNYYFMLIAFLVGFCVYFYMPIRARAMPPLNWGQLNEPTGWENVTYFVNMFHRKQYGKLGAAPIPAIRFEQIQMLFDIHIKQITPFVLLFVIPGLLQIFRKNKIFGYFTVFAMLSFALPLTYYINPDANNRSQFFFEVFFLPSTLYMIIWFAFGVQFYLERFGKKARSHIPFIVSIVLLAIFGASYFSLTKSERIGDYYILYIIIATILGLAATLFVHFRMPAKNDEDLVDEKYRFNIKDTVWALVILLFLVLVPGVTNFVRNNNRNNWANHDYSYNLMMSLEPNAILATEGGDNQVFGLAYFTMVERRRPDVKIYDQKGNVFERIYGNLMKTPHQWLENTRDSVDGQFIKNSGRSYYTTWKRPGIERIGNYYFKPYGILFRTQPIRHRFIDELEVYRSLPVSTFKELASSELNREYTDDEVAEDMRQMIEAGLIDAPVKSRYTGYEMVGFKKMYKTPFTTVHSEEEYWSNYYFREEMVTNEAEKSNVIKEQKRWDYLTREILVNYQFQRIDLVNRRIDEYNDLRASELDEAEGNADRQTEIRKKYQALIEEQYDIKLKALRKAEEYGHDMSPILFNISMHYNPQYGSTTHADDAKEEELLKRCLELDEWFHPALRNLANLYYRRSERAGYDEVKEREMLEESLSYINDAEHALKRTFGFNMQQLRQNQSYWNDYQAVMNFKNKVMGCISVSRKEVEEARAEAISKSNVSLYLTVATNLYARRQEYDRMVEMLKSANEIAKAQNMLWMERFTILRQRGNVLASMRRYDEAVDVYREMATLEGLPEMYTFQVRLAIGDLLAMAGHRDEAVASYRSILTYESTPQQTNMITLRIAEMYANAQMFEEASAYFKQAENVPTASAVRGLFVIAQDYVQKYYTLSSTLTEGSPKSHTNELVDAVTNAYNYYAKFLQRFNENVGNVQQDQQSQQMTRVAKEYLARLGQQMRQIRQLEGKTQPSPQGGGGLLP